MSRENPNNRKIIWNFGWEAEKMVPAAIMKTVIGKAQADYPASFCVV